MSKNECTVQQVVIENGYIDTSENGYTDTSVRLVSFSFCMNITFMYMNPLIYIAQMGPPFIYTVKYLYIT